ncbi:MAG: hypothetical protein FWF88_10505 [Peptococcaceae bacterium]|nr:hypothetical protein [Peptococcaceae bacterium]
MRERSSGRRSVVIIAFFLLLSLTACSFSVDGSGDRSLKSQINETDELTELTVSSEELRKEKERFSGMISSLDESGITKIELIRFDPFTDGEEICASDDPRTIETWITLLKQAEISPVSFELLPGDRFVILLYDADKVVEVGSFMFPYIYNSTNRTMNIIDNYEGLKEEFENAKEQILREAD